MISVIRLHRPFKCGCATGDSGTKETVIDTGLRILETGAVLTPLLEYSSSFCLTIMIDSHLIFQSNECTNVKEVTWISLSQKTFHEKRNHRTKHQEKNSSAT